MKALTKIAPIVMIIACAASLFFAFKLSGARPNSKRTMPNSKTTMGN